MRRTRRTFALAVASLLFASCGGGSVVAKPVETVRSAVDQMSALDKMSVAFEGHPSRDQVKAKLDRALTLYQTDITEENYSRAGSTLVGIRKDTGVHEIEILEHMIRSYLPGMKGSFPEAAAMSAAMIKRGQR